MTAMKTTRATILLTPAEMGAADRAAAQSGIDSFALMERAGQAVAAAVLRLAPEIRRAVVLCGPGNNGGDGYVAARALLDAGVVVEVYGLGDPAVLRGDARRAFELWTGTVLDIGGYEARTGDVVIDALFGAGLDRPVPDRVRDVIGRVADAQLPVVAVDLPSGVCGRTGRVLGAAFRATHTVTFMARKPGHLLLPGRDLCGTLEVFDIGIPWRLVSAQAGALGENRPEIWAGALPGARTEQHKFSRGHLAVFSGGATATGAARLAAMAALRCGAGLVTIAAPDEALTVNAAHLTAVMLTQVDDVATLERWTTDKRLKAFVLGPGFGVGQKARDFAIALRRRALVLDADGISSFAESPSDLFDAFAGDECRLVLTPHEGEFGRLFPDLVADQALGKVERARAAAARAHAVVVYKGADTVIAAPDGRALINANAPPHLATAGSGDVLAGMIGSLLAEGVPAFEAAAVGVWQHGAAGSRAGSGLTAETLVQHIQR